MKILTHFVLALSMFVGLSQSALAQNNNQVTKDQALAQVKKAITYYKANGREKTIAEINSRSPVLTDGSLYVAVTNMDGLMLATGGNSRMVGKVMNELVDADGKPFAREMLDMAKAGKTGWVIYRWANPVTKDIEKRAGYVEAFDGLMFSVAANTGF